MRLTKTHEKEKVVLGACKVPWRTLRQLHVVPSEFRINAREWVTVSKKRGFLDFLGE